MRGGVGSSTSGEASDPTNNAGTEGEGISTSGEVGGPTSSTSSKRAKVHMESALRI
jgi:hypothetical protein